MTTPDQHAPSAGSPFYITTPIYYVNDRPHVGSCYTTIVADCIARFMRLAGRDVFFLTGTDEHGQKVEKSAAEKGKTPQELADENARHFREAFDFIGSSHDDFIRTTEPRHEKQVQAALKILIDSGDIYLGTFEGWYDEGQEEYVTENQAREQDYTAFNGRPLVKATEQNYYFRLTKYWDRVRTLIEQNETFVRPAGKRSEVLGRLKDEARDVPISRTNFSWGIPVPGDEQHVTYVWIDALMNYMTALGKIDAGAAGMDHSRARYWDGSGEVVHLIGKEILWFHAVIWPALIMALQDAGRDDLKMPTTVYAHSFWIREGKKMSKTLGNFIDLDTIHAYCDRYGLDAFRWYMLTQGPLSATDADFAYEHFVEVYNADLANGYGNAHSRVTNMIAKYFGGQVPEPEAGVDLGVDWAALVSGKTTEATGTMRAVEVAGALAAAMDVSNAVDGFINETRPFTLAKDEANLPRVGTILYQCAEALRIAAVLLRPAMPTAMDEALKRLGCPIEDGQTLDELCAWGRLKPGTMVEKGEALFPRADAKDPEPSADAGAKSGA
ncbi:MAG: methionine--tRNA ligase [Phycisphaerales bacterium JB065]